MTVLAAHMPKKRKPTPSEIERWTKKPIVLQVRASHDWKTWLDKLVEFDRTTASELADRAIAEYAVRIGFPERPPRR